MTKKWNTLDKILAIVGGFLAAFIISTIIIYIVKDWPYDTLIQGVVGVGGVESIAMAGIQIAKYFKNKDKGDVEDDT